jgi:hypothetical protein
VYVVPLIIDIVLLPTKCLALVPSAVNVSAVAVPFGAVIEFDETLVALFVQFAFVKSSE